MQEGQLLMTQAERDRLATLKKAKKKLITQREAAEELGLSIRQVKRLLYGLKKRGDKAVVHGLRGKPSNRRMEASTEKEAIKILSAPVYQGFGPTLAAEYLEKKHGIEASKETVRQWMIRGKLWRAKKEQIKQVHVWRPRRSRLGELVQWDTSVHDWLEGRGEKLYLIAMIDDATSRLFARFVRHDSTEENMRLVWSYLKQFGRPVAFYTDKASHFQTAEKRKRDEPGVEKDAVAMPPTQIERALRELGITWIAAHSPQAKGRVERNFRDSARSPGERDASGWGDDDRASQRVSDPRLPGVVGAGDDGGSRQPRRRASPVGEEPQSGGIVEPRGNAAGAE
jgi:transposase InsO family protein